MVVELLALDAMAPISYHSIIYFVFCMSVVGGRRSLIFLFSSVHRMVCLSSVPRLQTSPSPPPCPAADRRIEETPISRVAWYALHAAITDHRSPPQHPPPSHSFHSFNHYQQHDHPKLILIYLPSELQTSYHDVLFLLAHHLPCLHCNSSFLFDHFSILSTSWCHSIDKY